jgi:hypothetical protein
MTVTATSKAQIQYPWNPYNATAIKTWVDAVTAIVNGTLPAAMLSADTEGRAAMQTGYFNEATATDKFAAAAIVGTLLKAGALAATTQGRALMATGYFDETTATDKFAAGAITTALLKAGVISADEAGRALMENGYFNEETASAKFAAGALVGTLLKNATVPSGKLDANTAAVLLADGASTGDVADLDAFTVANDGLTMEEGQRVLLKDQTEPAENGLYTLGVVNEGTAPLTRSTDMNATAHLKAGAIVSVKGGTLGANTMWQLTGDFPGDIATSHKHFTQVYNATQTAAAGITIAKRTVTVNDEDAGMTGGSYAVNIGAALPANAVVLAHEINIVEQFAGEDNTTITIGGTDPAAIVASTDLDALTAGKYAGTLGTHPQGTFSEEQLVATFAATELGDLTAGQAIITVWYSVLA